MDIQTVIFDYDGTLVWLNINFDQIRQEIEQLLVAYDIDLRSLKGLYVLEMIDEVTKRISEKSPYEGPAFYHTALEIVAEHEVMAAKKGQIIPGVTAMLKMLRKRGIKIAIITRNCDKAVKMVFPDIENFSDAYLPRDYVSQVKPHPDHLILALKKMEVNNPAYCLMVGDHLMDIEGGKRMGMKTAGVLTGKITRLGLMGAGADYILDDATAITGIIFKE
ncbi:MAG: HAD family hydrolase [Deltaproteobacteria bacterium]|nr:HAD family hydrolase [Deltaproteobacteria bacterium]